MIRLYKAFIDEIGNTEYEAEYKRLSEKARLRIDSINATDSRKSSLLGSILLRKGIKELFGVEDYEVSYTENGKPTLDFCKFSISHTKGLCVCAFSDTEIGIDAEQVRDIKRHDSYRFFTPREADYVNEDNAMLEHRFVELWTRKESYVKMLGGTMSKNGGTDVLDGTVGCIFSRADFDNFIITVCEKQKT